MNHGDFHPRTDLIFPDELWLQINDHITNAERKGLCLLHRRLRQLFLPCLYHTFHLESPKTIPSPGTAEGERCAVILGLVRHLVIVHNQELGEEEWNSDGEFNKLVAHTRNVTRIDTHNVIMSPSMFHQLHFMPSLKDLRVYGRFFDCPDKSPRKPTTPIETLVLSITLNRFGDRQKLPPPFVGLLRANSQTLKRLVLESVAGFSQIDFLGRLSSKRFPALETLELLTSDKEVGPLPFWDFLLSAPNITKLVIKQSTHLGLYRIAPWLAHLEELRCDASAAHWLLPHRHVQRLAVPMEPCLASYHDLVQSDLIEALAKDIKSGQGELTSLELGVGACREPVELVLEPLLAAIPHCRKLVLAGGLTGLSITMNTLLCILMGLKLLEELAIDWQHIALSTKLFTESSMRKLGKWIRTSGHPLKRLSWKANVKRDRDNKPVLVGWENCREF